MLYIASLGFCLVSVLLIHFLFTYDKGAFSGKKLLQTPQKQVSLHLYLPITATSVHTVALVERFDHTPKGPFRLCGGHFEFHRFKQLLWVAQGANTY